MDLTDSETQQPDDILDLETTFNSPPTLAQECKSFKWNIQVIDTDGHVEGKMVTSKDVWKLQNSRVIVHFDVDSGQPIGDSGGLLGSWLCQLSSDVNLLPIDYSDWRLFSPHKKERACDVIQTKFWFDDPIIRKEYVMGALGNRCIDVKLRLWKEYKKNSRIETMQNRPKNVPENQWNNFVHMRFTEKWKKMQARNTENQKKILCLIYVEERVFQGREMILKSRPEKDQVEESFLLRLVRNLTEASFLRRLKHAREHLQHC